MPAKGNQPINLSDIIGFIIAFLAFVYMALRPLIDKKLGRGAKRPFEEEREAREPEEDDEFEEEDFEEETPLAARERSVGVPPPLFKSKKREKDRFRFQSSIEKRHQPSAVEKRSLKSEVAERQLKELEANFEEELTEEEIYNKKEGADPSRASLFINSASLRQGVLIAEILGKPRAFSKNDGTIY